MPEKTSEEKDKEELEQRRLRDLLENRDNSFNLAVLTRFQRLETLLKEAAKELPSNLMDEIEKLKSGVNQLLADTEELLKSKDTKSEPEDDEEEVKPVKKEEEVKDDDDDDSSEDEEDDEDDDLGYQPKTKKRKI